MQSLEWIPVARLRKTRGRHGELLGEIYSSKPERVAQIKDVALELSGKRWETRVERIWFHDGTPVFQIAGLTSISEAEVWEGADVLVPPDNSLTLEDDEYRHSDLIGCKLFDGEREVGIVSEIQEYGGPITFVVRTTSGGEALVPFVRAFFKEIDIQAKVLRAQLPEGLVDL